MDNGNVTNLFENSEGHIKMFSEHGVNGWRDEVSRMIRNGIEVVWATCICNATGKVLGRYTRDHWIIGGVQNGKVGQ